MPNGTFVLADIGGYSNFLTDVGIEHAKEITSHIFNGMFEIDPHGWKVGNVQGDCLFLYADSYKSSADVCEYLQRLYESFRESLELIAAGSTCQCGACDRSGDLTLKFVAHAGEFDVQEVVGRQELIGPDIVVAHRLLKNSVPAREYALLTSRMEDVARCFGCNVASGRDEYSDLGSVEYVYVDLESIRDAFLQSRAIFLTEAEAEVSASIGVDAPPDLVWRLLMDAENMTSISPTLIEFETLSGAVDRAGSIHTCLHGDVGKVIHYRLGVDVANRRATDRLLGIPVVERALLTWMIEPAASGSTVTFRFAIEPGTPLPDEETRNLILDAAQRHADGDVQGIKAFCEAGARAT